MVWRRECAARGAFILTDKAALVGSDSATISRLERRIAAPGSGFIAGVLSAFPGITFEELFELVY